MNQRRILALTRRIFQQFRRDPRTLAMLFVVPVLMLSLLGYVYRGSDNSIELGVQGELESTQAQVIIQGLSDHQRLSVRTVESIDIDEALEDGVVDGVLVIPDEFSTASGGNSTVALVLDGSDPGRSASIIQAVQSVLPNVALQTLNPDSQPMSIDVQSRFGGQDFDQLDFLAPVFIGFFAFFLVFLLTSVAFLRERMQGSIERLMVSPISRPEIVTGYMLGFSFFAAIQSAVIIGFSVLVLDVHQIGNLGYVFVVTLLLALGAVNLGIFLSMFARTELQVVQFIPAVITPQALLSGMIWPVDTLPDPLRWAAHVMPLTYANEALRGVMIRGEQIGDISLELGVLAGFALLMVVLGSVTLRRDVA